MELLILASLAVDPWDFAKATKPNGVAWDFTRPERKPPVKGPCSLACTCGCQQGATCRCDLIQKLSTPTPPTAPIYQYPSFQWSPGPPVYYQPTQQFTPRASRGGC